MLYLIKLWSDGRKRVIFHMPWFSARECTHNGNHRSSCLPPRLLNNMCGNSVHICHKSKGMGTYKSKSIYVRRLLHSLMGVHTLIEEFYAVSARQCTIIINIYTMVLESGEVVMQGIIIYAIGAGRIRDFYPLCNANRGRGTDIANLLSSVAAASSRSVSTHP